MRIVIAGAGVGGLTTALSLHAAGFADVQIVEAAREVTRPGLGLNILPNAMRELTELGIDEPLAAHAVATLDLRLFHRCGTLIWREPRGHAAGYRWPQLAVSHGHLIAVLSNAVRTRLGTDILRTGVRVVGCRPFPGPGVQVMLESVDTGRREVDTVDLLIGADGIHSAVRASLYPSEGPAPVAPMVMWRGSSWVPPILTGKSMIVIGTDLERIVLYPIDADQDGTRCLINWVAACPSGPDGPLERPERVDARGVVDRFSGWSPDWLDLPTILRSADQVYRHPMMDRNPLPQWSFGAVTLLGDAAHAMLPMGSNGATQSIMDARVFAAALGASSDIPQAMARYESERRPAMTRLQMRNRNHGPEAVITLAHQRAPGGFDNVQDIISEQELISVAADYAGIAGLDVQYVNTRQSLSPPSSTRSSR
jgi:5-methylphenazine-1-carboxylate 1-monooxygenase